jgi:Peptidase family M28
MITVINFELLKIESNLLKPITFDIGPKVVGSNANEVLAANFILNYVNELKRNATNPDDVIIDHQIVSGTTFGSMSYVNLQNVVVKLQGETNNALLMNSHFDSVPGSPGGSDDAVMICVMLEILRVLSRESKRQKHSIVFLFNGAEEVGLQAAHGFITQHRFKDDIRALINLESTGSGGREILFQSGPKHDWLIRMYNEAAVRPFAHVVAEELFSSGLIPSATDFQIFRDYGNVPGIDFAYVEDGWRYHTRYDSIDYITLESVQHTGNNIISVTRRIANSKELENPPEGENAVYFEYLGFFMISYTESMGFTLNIVISILAFIIPFIYHALSTSENFCLTFLQTISSFITFVLSTVLSALGCYGLAFIMNYFDNSMSWFNTIWLSIGLYWCLAVIIQLLTYQLFQAIFDACCFRTKKYRETSLRKKVQGNMNGVNLFWALFTIGVTLLGYRLGYLTMILMFISLVTFIIQIIMKPLLREY